MIKIVKQSKGKLLIFDKNYPNGQIFLDFNPFLDILEKERLENCLLVHLRARPPQTPNAWTYGIYLTNKDEYVSVKSLISQAPFSSLKVENSQKPTDVFAFVNALLIVNGDEGIIQGIEEKPFKKKI